MTEAHEYNLQIDGMHCGSCVRRVSQALSATEGIQVGEVRVGGARLAAASQAALESAVAAVNQLGFTAHLEQ